MTHPAQMGASEISQFLTWLAVDRRVSASTQNQALSALLFLYKHVLAIEIAAIPPVVRARTPERLPVVLSREEVGAILKQLTGTERLIVMLLYGSGLRLEECLDLRVKDLDFDRHQIIVRQGKGQKDRVTMLPAAAREALTRHLADVRRLHERIWRAGSGASSCRSRWIASSPTRATEWRWQFVFPAATDLPRSAIRTAVPVSSARVRGAEGGGAKRRGWRASRSASARTRCAIRSRRSLLEDGYDIRTVQELLGHRDVRTTMTYLHVMNRGALGVKSPMDRL